ncbi:N2227-like protein-domain-containing protein [Dipodascopsis uninucleata]
MPDHEAEERALTSTLNAMGLYTEATMSMIVEPRMRIAQAMQNSQSSEAETEVISRWIQQLEQVSDAVRINGDFLKQITMQAVNEFGAPLDTRSWARPTSLQFDQTRSTLKQLAREWSVEGSLERDISYGRVIEALTSDKVFGKLSQEERSNIRVLVPGAGLGRLPYEIALRGFQSQGNEFSYHMLAVSSFMLNSTKEVEQFDIYPYATTFSHVRTSIEQVRTVRIPDLCPATVGISTAGRFSFTAGDFIEIYGHGPDDGKFDAVATVFFLDTARNVLQYIETIRNCLLRKRSNDPRYWVNFGPLLYHFEDDVVTSSSGGTSEGSVELPLDVLLDTIKNYGFEIIEFEDCIPCTYASDRKAMGRWIYDAVFWIARLLPS